MISRLVVGPVQSGRWRRKLHLMTLCDAVEKTLVRHPTVGFFMGRTYDFLIGIGIDANRLRFRQHASDEMAHYATIAGMLRLKVRMVGSNVSVLRIEDVTT